MSDHEHKHDLAELMESIEALPPQAHQVLAVMTKQLPGSLSDYAEMIEQFGGSEDTIRMAGQTLLGRYRRELGQTFAQLKTDVPNVDDVHRIGMLTGFGLSVVTWINIYAQKLGEKAVGD
jgi:hypothetical protein